MIAFWYHLPKLVGGLGGQKNQPANFICASNFLISESIGDSPFYCLYGREPRLPVDVKFLPPAADDLSTSVLDHRKRIVEKVELAQNLARENIQLSQQKM